MGWIINNMKKRNIKSLFDETVIQTRNNIMSFIDKIRTEGYAPRWNTQKFKITHFDKAFRPYLKGVYIIADKECNKNGELFSRYKNAKFLIFFISPFFSISLFPSKATFNLFSFNVEPNIPRVAP